MKLNSEAIREAMEPERERLTLWDVAQMVFVVGVLAVMLLAWGRGM